VPKAPAGDIALRLARTLGDVSARALA